MKVDLAVQTLSASTADSLESLMKHGVPDFEDAAATIRFVRLFNDLFDIFNTKSDDIQTDNIFKRALSTQNHQEIFALFEFATHYIKHLKFIDPDNNNRLKDVCSSQIRTGFKGFIINMAALTQFYREYVETKMLNYIPVYWLNQDSLEIFFGKVRASNGFNSNPTMQQFKGNIRKLITYDAILCSKYANCFANCTIPAQPFANILFVSSRSSINAETSSNGREVLPAELETLYQRLAEIEALEEHSLLDDLSDYSISYTAAVIEQRIVSIDSMYCMQCKDVFKQNDKIRNALVGSKFKEKPCRCTIEVCKEADRFVKMGILQSDFDIYAIREAIFNLLDVQSLYANTDFNHNPEHKLYLVRSIIDVYIQIKATQIARSTTLEVKQSSYASKLRKLTHVYGQ